MRPWYCGSATPDVTTFAKSEIGAIEVLKLSERANKAKLPKVEIVDLKEELANRQSFYNK